MSKTDRPAFLDTSYVVRYLTGDPPAMAERAARIIDTDQPLILSELVRSAGTRKFPNLLL